MSIKYNGKLIAGKYKTQIVTDATESNKGLIRIATLEEVNAGTDTTTAVTPKDLATKQNTLTAGEGIKIENGIISTESTKILTDNVTIIQNDDNTITSIGTKTKSNTNLYDWVGTEEEYNTGVSSGIITEDTQCIITDDEQELIGTFELNIPTKVSDLANDSNFVNSVELDTKQDIISDLDTIRAGATLGSTALQSIPDEYVTETELNAKGYLTSYTETDPIYTADKPNIAKVDLSNLAVEGKDKLNTSKMYTTGAVSTDVQGYNQLVEMKQNGVKTGVDVLQEGNYRTFGTPAITNDGIASGFSSNNYIQTINPINLDASFKINCKFSIGNELPSLIYLYSSDYGSNNLRITITSSAIYFFQGSTTKIQGVTVNTLNKNFQLTFEKHSNTEYYIYLYDTTNGTIIFDQTITTSAGGDYKNSTLSFGKTLSADNNENTLKIDLNAFEVYSNGNLVYKPQPRIEIPYTLSKSGSKIVDAAYRDKVMKIYENEGQAGYYTIDEENENFTLPMGEIYGMIETIKNKYVQKSGDTMTGALNFNESPVVKDFTSNTNCYVQRTERITSSSATVESNVYVSGLSIVDDTGYEIAKTEIAKYKDGTIQHNFLAHNINGVGKGWVSIGVGYKPNGTPITYAPTPPTSDNSTQIATTAWVKALPRLIETWESDWFTSPGASKSVSFNLAGTGMNATNAPHIFIEMIGKVVTADGGYAVGDIIYPQFANYNGQTGKREEGQSVFFSGNTLTYAQGNSTSWVGTKATGGHGGASTAKIQIKIILRRFSN